MTRPAQEQFREAMTLHRQGKLSEAARLYEDLLLREPGHVEALHFLGVVALQSGQNQRGVQLIAKALTLNPHNAEALCNLGNGYRALNRAADAVAAYDRAAALKPGMIEAHLNRGLALLDLGQPAAALAAFDAVLALKPGHAGAHCNRGNALHALKRLDDAASSFKQAIDADPGLAEAHANRGNVLLDLGQPEEALACAERALALRPGLFAALVFRGSVLLALNRPQEALQSFEAAIAQNQEHAPAHAARGHALVELNRPIEALSSYDRALALEPDAAVHVHRALVLLRLKRAGEALESSHRALAINSGLLGAHLSRANALVELGRLEEALADFEHLVRAGEHVDYALGFYLDAKLRLCDWAGFQEHLDHLIAMLESGKRPAGPFLLLQALDAPALQLKCATAYASTQRAASGVRAQLAGGSEYKIRVGYFSSDFREHPVTHLLCGVLAKHDRRRFEISAYSFSDKDDAWSQRVRESVDRFVKVDERSVRDIVAAARDARLDIAVDLNGYTKNARTSIFASRAAPLQIAYLGYLGSMGADYVDYMIADHVLIPPEQRQHYSEKVIYLPWYQCNDEDSNAPGAPLSRAHYGLREDAFVFGSFNNSFKITPGMFDIWMRVLRRTPGSILWLYAENAAAARNLTAEAMKRGVEADRLVFAAKRPRPEHLARQRLVDLFLDTFPYNGGVTTSNALRAGVPVLTLAGASFASRMGASLLTAVGLESLIALSAEQYQERAVAWAADVAELSMLKSRVADGQTAELFSAAAFTRRLEAGYCAAVARHRAGAPPADINIDEVPGHA